VRPAHHTPADAGAGFGSKNYQLDLFDASTVHFEYTAAVTNEQLTGANLWYFICGRGWHEKVVAELRRSAIASVLIVTVQ